MQGKIKFILPLVALIVLGVGYKTVLAKPAEGPPPKVHGQLYVIPKEFLINLADQRYAKLTVALEVSHEEVLVSEDAHAAAPPEGWGTLPQEAMIRTLVTDTLTGIDGDKLVEPEGREKLATKLLKKIKKYSDVHAEEVLFTDIAVQ
ncbi:MAG TPA: flagellar basal body-associated FliL family protein [Solirubrobacteraceae bacterium]|nr:flagellar basal body-associated FliL family protein [Solirubrobacteraceae bacterium]